MISVVVPLYNKELSVGNTIQSVLNQSFQDFELVIVNDGSTDKSAEIARSFQDKRIRVINKSNGGVSSARNLGIKEAKFEWIAFLDADDLWKENHLATLRAMQNDYPDDKVFTTSFIRSNEIENTIEDTSLVIINDYFKEALIRHVTCTSVICIHKAIFNSTPAFNESLNRGEDLDLWARIGRKNRYIKSNLITAVYQMDAENKLTATRSVYNNSILSIIDLKGLNAEERIYFKRFLFKRLKSNIRGFNFIEILQIIFKHRTELLK